MNIKDFKVGQKVFVLDLYRGREKHVIREEQVAKVGRKYVYLTTGIKYEYCDWCEFGLIEAQDWGNRSFLFASEAHAKMEIEKRELALWLNSLRTNNKYTLKQLRKVKEILDS